MASHFLHLFFGILLCLVQYGTAEGDPVPVMPLSSSLGSSNTPTVDKPESVNTNPTIAGHPPAYHPDDKQAWTPFIPFVNPNIFINPFENFNQIHIGLFSTIVEEFKTVLEVIKQRQNVLLKYVECSCPNVITCKKAHELEDDDLRGMNDWNWSFSRLSDDVVRADNVYVVMAAFKTTVEKLTLRQKFLYEYVACSCNVATECSTSLKPLLDIMFTDNHKVSEEIIQNIFVPGTDPSSKGVFEYISNLVTHVPHFGGWLNPYANLFGSIFGGGYFPYNIRPMGHRPTHATSTATSTNTHNGHSSSSSISASSSGETSHSEGHPTHEHYVINNAGGGTTHVSTATDGAGGSSVSVASSSGKEAVARTARQFIFGGPAAIASQAVAAGQQTAYNAVAASQGVGINAANVGIAAGNVGVNAGLQAANVGIAAGNVGMNAGLQAANVGIAAGNVGVNAGLQAAYYTAG